MKTIFLIGMPGSGKTSFGKRAAKELNMTFLDTDAIIEERDGMTIAELFAQKGEPYFRARESAMIAEIAAAAMCEKGMREASDFGAAANDADTAPGSKIQIAAAAGRIVSVGGGAIEREENVRAMRRGGIVVFIDRSLADIESGVRYGADRPLLSDSAGLAALYARRSRLYPAAAHRVLKNEGEYERVLERLLAMICLLGVTADYCVIGDPIAHSLSPLLHGAAFKFLGADAVYGAARVPRGQLRDALADVRAGRLKGMNVTVPHKFGAAEYADETQGDAVRSGAVNTLLHREGRLIGYNTDMEGLLLALNREGQGYAGRNVAILGSGGAAAGVAHKAAAEGASRIVLVGRNVRMLREISAACARGSAPGRGRGGAASGSRVRIDAARYDFETPVAAGAERARGPVQLSAGADVPDSAPGAGNCAAWGDILSDTDILINATPLGMEGAAARFSDFDFLKALPKRALVYDLIYRPAETALLTAAKTLGLNAVNGLGMLIYQGILSDELFLDRSIDGADRETLFEVIRGRLMMKGGLDRI
ncbi:MAG: hypothetical protein LBO81_04460 [Clostridiales Family XIII bacterium]|jgi:shikimate dehydrogenase|nr:hypothetical protein [Clostridiales Family XIII bacterium]